MPSAELEEKVKAFAEAQLVEADIIEIEDLEPLQNNNTSREKGGRKLVFEKSPLNGNLIKAEPETEHWASLSVDEKFKRVENTYGISKVRKAEIIKKIILDSFLGDGCNPQELIQYITNIKLRKPEIAIRLLVDVLKLEQQEKLFRLKERKEDERPKHAPIIIVNSQNNNNLISPEQPVDMPPVKYIERPKLTANILDSEIEEQALKELNDAR